MRSAYKTILICALLFSVTIVPVSSARQGVNRPTVSTNVAQKSGGRTDNQPRPVVSSSQRKTATAHSTQSPSKPSVVKKAGPIVTKPGSTPGALGGPIIHINSPEPEATIHP